jgi:DNA-binding MarR family transcriptional regulator
MINPFSSHLGFLLRAAAKNRSRSLTRQLAPLGVSVTEASIVAIIERNPGVSQVEICRMLGMQRANMAPMVHSLTREGWIGIIKKDKRSQGLELTDKGRELAAASRAAFYDHEHGLAMAIPIEMRPFVVPILIALGDFEDGGAI